MGLTTRVAMFQMCQMQTELEEEKAKVKQMLASAEEQHSHELARLLDQRDSLQEQLRELQQEVQLLSFVLALLTTA